MKVFIQSTKNYLPCNSNFFQAYQGFHEMGFETIFFHNKEELLKSEKEDVVVGYVKTVRSRLMDFGITTPEMDYPEELMDYMGRKIWYSKVNTINSHPELWPVFIKPIEDKKFTGVVVNSPKDLIGCGSCYDNADIICSEIVDFIAEWRCFVRYGQILDVRLYKGNWRVHHNAAIIEHAVKNFTSAPAGYAIDFGLTKDGRFLLIEVNDGYSLGCYGLFYLDYAKLLSARWAELTNINDECNFYNHMSFLQ